MPKLRFLLDAPHDVPLLGCTVKPDHLVDIPEDVFSSREWPESVWAVVDHKQARKGADTAEGA